MDDTWSGMEEMRAMINSILEQQANLQREIEACRSRIEILREMNSTFEEELAKAAADRQAPGTPSPPATDSRVGSPASGQQMQSAGLQGGAENGEEAQEGDGCRGEEDAHESNNTSSNNAAKGSSRTDSYQ